MITFNPDPKLQAEAMIKTFQKDVGIGYSDAISGTLEVRDMDHEEAKACALIAAEMCKSACFETNSYRKETFMSEQYYWIIVIDELKKP